MRPLAVLLSGLTLCLVLAWQAAAQYTGLPIPRFVSLRADEVNMRAGPGETYPVEWVYGRSGLPLEVVAEFKNWRKVRDWEGSEGWIHQSLLSGRRTALVTGTRRVLRATPEPQAPAVAMLEPGVVVRLLQCPSGRGYCRIDIAGIKGWLDRRDFWGVYPNESID